VPTDDGYPDICLGRCFYPSSGDSHLYVIASDPAQDSAHIAVVNISSKPGDGDAGYTLDKGDHPGITHQSFIRCDFADLTDTAELESRVAKSTIRLTHRMTGAPLRKVQRALAESPRPTRQLQGLLKAQGFVK
jgi:hypothetical protein